LQRKALYIPLIPEIGVSTIRKFNAKPEANNLINLHGLWFNTTHWGKKN